MLYLLYILLGLIVELVILHKKILWHNQHMKLGIHHVCDDDVHIDGEIYNNCYACGETVKLENGKWKRVYRTLSRY